MSIGMSLSHYRSTLSYVLPLVSVLGAGCGSPDNPNDQTPDGGNQPAPDLSGSGGNPDLTTSGMSQATFRYTPQWDGVTKVEVVGGFGLASDWSKTDSFLTLQNDGTGTFTGTAMLANQQYTYVLRVTETANGKTTMQYAIDPMNSGFTACPMASPTFDAAAVNPCSVLTVPQGAPATPVHVHGTVNVDGAATAGYNVMLEREEPTQHHFFANQMLARADGTYDLVMAPGQYRLQVFPPSYATTTDANRNPLVLQTLRRAISMSFPVSQDVAPAAVEMAYHDYARFSPTKTAALPVTLSYPVPANTMVQASVYGTAMMGKGVNIGDPWWNGANNTKTSAVFNGTFNTKQATETTAASGEQYYWGTWITLPKDNAGVQWRGQTMVFPIKF